MNVTEAKNELIRRLQELVPKLEVTIVMWSDGSAGPRIAEISFVDRNPPPPFSVTGFSYMQSDSSCGNILFFAERFIVEYSLGRTGHGTPEDDDYEPDFAGEAWESLKQNLQPAPTENERRFATLLTKLQAFGFTDFDGLRESMHISEEQLEQLFEDAAAAAKETP